MPVTLADEHTSARPPIDSLSASQVGLLLRTVSAHRDHLDAAHHDARNLLHGRLRPAYVLDFDLLYRYMFEHDSAPDWSQALTYLLQSFDTTYIVGPGTETEIQRLLGELPAPGDAPLGQGPTADLAEAGLARLHNLLSQDNVLAGDDIPSGSNDAAYQQVKLSLDSARRRAPLANHADALNWAYVVHLRRNVYECDLGYFPYLLTSTTLLLDDHALDPDHAAVIARSTQAAIYCKVLLDVYPDPVAAMRHTVELAFESAKIERSLRLSPAYVDPTRFNEEEIDWEQVLSRHDVTPDFEATIATLASYFNDEVLYEAQRIYDNTYFAATSQAQFGGIYPFVGQTPRRLFDLISAISGALATDDRRRARGLESVWESVLELKFSEVLECVTVALVDRSSRVGRPPYLVIEVHPPAPGRVLPLFIMRWPSSRDAAGLVGAFTDSFVGQSVTDLSMTMGTSQRVYEFDARLPITLDEMSEALLGEVRKSADPGAAPTELMWFRADSPMFDLYADIQAPVPQDALVGVFGEELTALPIAKLYSETSSRYLFSAWLRAALTEIGRRLPGILAAWTEQSHPAHEGTQGADQPATS